MKKTILASIMMLSTGLFTFAQDLAPNSVKLKVKSSNGLFQYSYLPEYPEYSEYEDYSVTLKDVDGKEYTTRTNIGEKRDVPFAMYYLENLTHEVSDGDFHINITRLDTRIEKLTKKEYSSGGDNPTKLFGYTIEHKDKYAISIIDAKGDKGVIYDTTLTILGKSLFPKDYNEKLHFSNEGLALKGLDQFMYNTDSKDFDIKKTSDLIKKHNSGKTQDPQFVKKTLYILINGDLKHKLRGTISQGWYLKRIDVFEVKTKEKVYEEINEAASLVNEAIKIMKQNYKDDVVTNFHDEKIFLMMDQAYIMLEKYRDKKYIKALTEDVQDLFEIGMNINIFFTAISTSRFDEANNILKDIKVFMEGVSDTNLKRTELRDINHSIDVMVFILEREQRLFEKHKDIYNFYK